jgi:hypothetical protein
MCTYTWNTDKPCWQYAGDGRHHCRLEWHWDHNEDHVCWCDEITKVQDNTWRRVREFNEASRKAYENRAVYDDFGAIPYICDYTWSTGEAGETCQCTLIHDPREKNVLHYDEVAGAHDLSQPIFHTLTINGYIPLSGLLLDDNPPLAFASSWFWESQEYISPSRWSIIKSKLLKPFAYLRALRNDD